MTPHRVCCAAYRAMLANEPRLRGAVRFANRLKRQGIEPALHIHVAHPAHAAHAATAMSVAFVLG
jgi:hypothetical protein